MAQDQQLGVFGHRTSRQQCQPSQHLAEHEVQQSQGHPSIIAADGLDDELAAQHRRLTSWHPRVAAAYHLTTPNRLTATTIAAAPATTATRRREPFNSARQIPAGTTTPAVAPIAR